MSDLEELERERGNKEYMETKAGIAAANGFMDFVYCRVHVL